MKDSAPGGLKPNGSNRLISVDPAFSRESEIDAQPHFGERVAGELRIHVRPVLSAPASAVQG